MTATVDQSLHHLVREDAGRVVAVLAERFGDLDLADDAVQEALIEAAQTWPRDGTPTNPAGWLHQVAKRKAIDTLRRDDVRRRRIAANAPDILELTTAGDTPSLVDDGGLDPGDERLRLLLLCCHPALELDAQVALTLRLVSGLTTEEIASAFLVPTSTLAQRISRAKRKIRTANIAMTLPESLDERLGAVRTVVYLTFNEGYLTHSPTALAHRVDLCDEAVRLMRLVVLLAPDQAESNGLLSLLLLTHARRDARFDQDRIVLLDDQDRSTWRQGEIAEGNQCLRSALEAMEPGPFQLQAIIASHHSNAASPGATDWQRIVELYDQLMAMVRSPVVALNRAAAVAMASGPQRGLDELETIDGLDDYHLFHATKGELLARSGDTEAAIEALQRASEASPNESERLLLTERLARLL